MPDHVCLAMIHVAYDANAFQNVENRRAEGYQTESNSSPGAHESCTRQHHNYDRYQPDRKRIRLSDIAPLDFHRLSNVSKGRIDVWPERQSLRGWICAHIGGF